MSDGVVSCPGWRDGAGLRACGGWGRGGDESFVECETGFEGAAHRTGLGDLLEALSLVVGEVVGEVDGDLDPPWGRVGVVIDGDAQIAEVDVSGFGVEHEHGGDAGCESGRHRGPEMLVTDHGSSMRHRVMRWSMPCRDESETVPGCMSTALVLASLRAGGSRGAVRRALRCATTSAGDSERPDQTSWADAEPSRVRR
jgi:hypothetical protein